MSLLTPRRSATRSWAGWAFGPPQVQVVRVPIAAAAQVVLRAWSFGRVVTPGDGLGPMALPLPAVGDEDELEPGPIGSIPDLVDYRPGRGPWPEMS